MLSLWCVIVFVFFFFQAEDGIRDLVRSRGLGDVYKRQPQGGVVNWEWQRRFLSWTANQVARLLLGLQAHDCTCLLYTSDAADERSSVDLGGRRIIKKKKKRRMTEEQKRRLTGNKSNMRTCSKEITRKTYEVWE